MRTLFLFVVGFAFVCAGIFLIHRARRMPSTVDRQLNSQPDTWYDFESRVNMFAMGFLLIVIGCVGGYRALVDWFM